MIGMCFIAAPAVAQTTCTIADQNIETELSKIEGIRGGQYGSVRRDMRELRSAAMVLQSYGKTEACQALVSAMTDLLRQPAATLEMRGQQTTINKTAQTGSDSAATTTDTTGSTTSTDATAPNTSMGMSMADRRKGATAFFVNNAPMSASELIGSDVYGPDNDSIGEIEDLIVAGGDKPGFALISYGGFLGMGESRAAVPLRKLSMSSDGYVFTDMTADQLQKAPAISRDNRDWWSNTSWMSENDAYYR
jgi:Tfp pilus assembly major pilin PilA